MSKTNTIDGYNDKVENIDAFFTNHGRKRLKERNGWGKKTSERMIRKILENGEDMSHMTGYLGIWAREKLKTQRKNHRFLLYGTQVYIFAKNMLITVFPIPSRQQVLRKAS